MEAAAGDAAAVGRAVETLRRATGAPEARTAGTLYWYALSRGLARLAVAGKDAATAIIASGPGGWPEVGETAPSDESAAGLARACRHLIQFIADGSGASARSLWAIATDSIASAALDAEDPRAAAAALLRACAPEAPPARFDEVPGRGTVVRRGSCCLLYQCPGMAKCLSCPRQTPEERRARLA